MPSKKPSIPARLEALFILGVAGVYVWEGFNIPAYYSLPRVPGPTVFPIILGIVMAGAALWLVIFPSRPAKEKKILATADRWQGFLQARWRFYLMWGLLIAYVILLPPLGFLICSTVLLAALFFLLGERRWYIGILIACVFTIAIYLLFAEALKINLPLGILEDVLKP